MQEKLRWCEITWHGKGKESGQYRYRVIAHHFGYPITVLGQSEDESCNAPDIEWECKLQPRLGISIKTIEKACLHTQIQIEPCYEDS